MDRAQACIVGALTALALVGCIGVPLQKSTVEKELRQKQAALVIGETERVQVRQLLGEPLLASEYWRFDAFEISDWNSGVLFIGYIPIPLWEKNEGFALVAYREDGRVADFAWGHRAKGAWIWPSADSDAVAELGDLRLWTSDDQLYLAASPKRRDAYLSRSVPEGSCRVVLGCERGDKPVHAHVDSASLVSDTGAVINAKPSGPPDMIVWNGAVMTAHESMVPQPLTVLTLNAGSRRIDAVPVAGREPIPASVRFDCESGATHYALLKVEWAEDAGATSQRPRFRALVEIMKERPSVFDLRPLLIWGNGQWLVEQEPGR